MPSQREAVRSVRRSGGGGADAWWSSKRLPVPSASESQKALLVGPVPDVPHQRRGYDDQREGDAEDEDRDERRARDRDHDAVLQGPPPDLQDGLHHDRQHCRLEPEEHGRDERDVLESSVQNAQEQDRHESRQHEEPAGEQAAPPSVQHPAPIGGELLRFRSREEHGVVQGVEEAVLAEPALLVHEDSLHHRDLAGWTSEAVRGHADPDAQRLPDGDSVRGCASGSVASAQAMLRYSTTAW